MFGWIGDIGPNTWALFILFFLLLVGLTLLQRGWIGTLIGILVSIGSSAAIAQIIAFDGARDPWLHSAWGVTVSLIVATVIGLGLAFRRIQSGSSASSNGLRSRIPEINVGAGVAVIVGLLMVVVSGSVIVKRIDLPSNEAKKGFDIATEKSSRHTGRFLQEFEKFLAQ